MKPTDKITLTENRKRRLSWPLWMTPQQVADMFGVHRNTVYEWVRAGQLPHRKLGTQIFIDRDAMFLRSINHIVLNKHLAERKPVTGKSDNDRTVNCIGETYRKVIEKVVSDTVEELSGKEQRIKILVHCPYCHEEHVIKIKGVWNKKND